MSRGTQIRGARFLRISGEDLRYRMEKLHSFGQGVICTPQKGPKRGASCFWDFPREYNIQRQIINFVPKNG